MRNPPFEVSKNILKEKFPGASFAFVAGSFNRNEQTEHSDIDLVVIYPKLENAWRESFMFDGWPVEAFVHDPDTLKYFFLEVDAKDGSCVLPSMVLEGPVVPGTNALAMELKSFAQEVISKGPPAWNEEAIYHQRYFITDLIDDLRSPRNKEEARAVIGSLHEVLANFYFRANGSWSSSRKHILRTLKRNDPTLYVDWLKAFDDAYSGNTSPVIKLTETIVSPHGGLLFDGYKREAPAAWRI